MAADNYVQQVRLLVQVLPFIAEEACFARARRMADLGARFGGPVGRFLLGLHDADPDFGLIGLPQAALLPAVQWKLVNLARLKRGNPAKHAEQRALLEAVLDG